jgi:hypothetical protein
MQQVTSTTNATSLTTKKVRTKTITKKGPGVFVECGMVKFGYKEQSSKIPRIGIWGVVKWGNKPLKEIAALVYRDATMVRFLANANKINGDIVSDGKELFIPNITKESMRNTKSGRIVSSHYMYIGFNMAKVKPESMQKGDFFVNPNQAHVKEYFFNGKDHKSRLFSDQLPLSYKTYIAEIGGSKDLADPFINLIKFLIGYDNQIDAGFGMKDAIHDCKYVESKISRNGNWVYKVSKGAKQFNRTYSFDNASAVAKRYLKGNFAVENMLTTVYVSGIKALIDFDEKGHAGHAIYTFGISVIKDTGATLTAATTGALALLIPGAGEIVALPGSVVVGYVAATTFDEWDAQNQKEGKIPEWAKLYEPKYFRKIYCPK